nr:hypothetical protein [Tanacetum cinerariifolium]
SWEEDGAAFEESNQDVD